MFTWLVLIAGLALSALAAAAGTALATVNRVRLLELARDGDGQEQAAERLVEHPLRTRATLLVLHTAGWLAVGAGVTWLAYTLVSTRGVAAALAVAVPTTGLLVLLELAVKAWAAGAPESRLLALVRPLDIIVRLVHPLLTRLGPIAQLTSRALSVELPENVLLVREDELRYLVNVDEGNGSIHEDEIEMIAGIMELGETRVREVMVPRIDVVAIPIDSTLDEALDTIISAGHSRIPVYRESIDEIAGLLYAKDLLRAFRARDFEPDLAALLRDPYFVPESKPVDALLQELQASKVHIAIVVDEYGGTAGIVTIEDLLEEIVGEIQDEYDKEEPQFERISADESVFGAGMDIDDVNRMMDIHLPTDEVDTLAGLVFTRLGKVPEPGECARFEDAEIEVLEVSGRRIQRVRVERRPAPPEEAPLDTSDVAPDAAGPTAPSG